MAFMGYETPVEIPSMGVYDTDLMKMYIAGIKDQYEKGQEEMKDFMKLYADFYSDIPGATEAYNQMTIGGARNMINQMMAAGIDPYKSPEARAAISRYIASVPTGKINEMKKSAENAKAYKAMEAKMKANGTWGSDDFQRFVLGGKLLDEWDVNTPFTATSPYEYKDLDALTAQLFAPFKAQEYLGKSRNGYVLYGTKPQRQELAVLSAINELNKTPNGQYQYELAKRQALANAAANGIQLDPKQLEEETAKELYKNVKISAAKYFQPQEVEDKRNNDLEKMRLSASLSDWQDKQKQARSYEYWKKKQEANPNSPFYKGDKPVASKTGKTYASWWEMFEDLHYVTTKGSSKGFVNGLVKKLHGIYRNGQGVMEISDLNIHRAINAMSQEVPSYTLSTLLSRNANKDGSINISRADIGRLYHIDQVALRMYGAPSTKDSFKDSNDKTKDARRILNNSIGAQNADMSGSDRIKGATMAPQDRFVYYVNKNGKVKVFVPVSVVTDKNAQKWNNSGYADDLMYDTGISGKIDGEGNFVPDNEQYLTTFDNAMTLKYASKTDHLYPQNPDFSTFDWNSGEFGEESDYE